MNLKKYISVIIISLITLSVYAQDYKLREVSKEELEKQYSEIDSTTGAEILFYDKNVYYDVTFTSIDIITEVRKRIKFYNNRPEDLEYATEEIYLYVDGERESVSKIKAYSYNLINGQVEETKLDRSQIFEKELSTKYEKTSFTLPKIKKGTVIDIYYKKRSPYFFNIEEFEFQFDIPAEKITATIATPEDFIFKRIPKGSVDIKYSLETKMDQRLGSMANIYSYSAEDIPALKDESFVDNIENYRGGILFELMSTKDRYGNLKNYSKSWGDVAKTIGYSDDYEDEIEKTNIFEDDIDQLIANADSKNSIELAKDIFNHAKQNLKWNDEKGKYFDNGIRQTYKEKSGNAADINLSLVAMLRYAGFDASPIVISTRDNLKPVFPTVDRLNYVIGRLMINDNEYLLDATDKYSEFNVLPIRDYNFNGVMVDTPNKLWRLIDLKEPETSTLVNLVSATLTEDGVIKGKVKTQKDNHYSYLYDYKVENAENDGAVTEIFSYEYEKAVDKIGDKIFLKPFMFFIEDENPFKLEERNFPVDFVYSFSDKYVINLKIPNNYEITSLPEPMKLQFGENSGMYKYVVSGNGKFIRLAVDLDMYKSRILPEDYQFLKQFFNEKIKKESEQIVLTKIK